MQLNFFSCRYEYFYALLRDFPDLRFTINGGINTINEVTHFKQNGFLFLLWGGEGKGRGFEW